MWDIPYPDAIRAEGAEVPTAAHNVDDVAVEQSDVDRRDDRNRDGGHRDDRGYDPDDYRHARNHDRDDPDCDRDCCRGGCRRYDCRLPANRDVHENCWNYPAKMICWRVRPSVRHCHGLASLLTDCGKDGCHAPQPEEPPKRHI